VILTGISPLYDQIFNKTAKKINVSSSLDENNKTKQMNDVSIKNYGFTKNEATSLSVIAMEYKSDSEHR